MTSIHITDDWGTPAHLGFSSHWAKIHSGLTEAFDRVFRDSVWQWIEKDEALVRAIGPNVHGETASDLADWLINTAMRGGSSKKAVVAIWKQLDCIRDLAEDTLGNQDTVTLILEVACQAISVVLYTAGKE